MSFEFLLLKIYIELIYIGDCQSRLRDNGQTFVDSMTFGGIDERLNKNTNTFKLRFFSTVAIIKI